MLGPRIRTFASLLVAVFVLAACTGPAEPIWDTDEFVARSTYSHEGPTKLTLFTVINNKTGAGAHSALMVNGSQRVMFDPAGTWHHPQLPERNDVHFGMSEPIVDFYIDYHSRETHHTIIQEIEVSPAVAQVAMAQMMSYGAVPKAQCSHAITAILENVPGFEAVGRTWFPKNLSERFAALQGVQTNVVYDDSPSDNSGMIAAPIVRIAQ
ncbi:MAG: hypothetical protein V3V25_08555 [Paracoccaceae bacterium]